jgi:predicted MPP superfamily phosphohydrolase
MTRREWIKAGVTLAPAVLTAGGAIFGERQLEQFRLRRLILPISGLPPSLDGLTIAHVSDVHVGHFTRGAVLERIVRTTNDLKADLVLMTGDLINLALRDLPVGIDLVRGLRGREGVFLCEGNHDLMEDPVKFRREVRRAGLPFLLEEGSSVAVHGTSIQVLGTAWSHTDVDHAESMERLRALRDPKAFHIVLAHHPHAFDFADDFPLMLAGHTHGGQLMLTQDIGCGPWMFRYWSGEYRRPGRTLVVSNGVGNWFPVRINAPAEILHLTLRPA